MNKFPTPPRFSWYFENRFAAGAYPGRYRKIEYDLEELEAQGIKHIINLHDPISLPARFRNRFQILNESIPDGYPPEKHQIEYILDYVSSALARNEKCLVCCRGGRGRTATILAILLIELAGLSLKQALELLKKDGRAPQTLDQLNFLKNWEKEKFKKLTR